jgi:hypothetical protein
MLGESERAIDAVLQLIAEQPDAVSVEFLFAAETRAMRQSERFGLVVEALGLDDYWSSAGASCPSLFERTDEKNWCN